MFSRSTLLIIIVIGFLGIYFYNTHIEFFSSQDPVLNALQRQLAVLHPRFQNVELYVGDKSYTINKQRVFICLKDKHGRYYSRNMLCYVVLHEYAHMLCDEIGHTAKFAQVFEELLRQASIHGLYDPSIPPLTDYCGHD